MSLLDILKSDSGKVTTKKIHQIVAIAGDGTLKDNNETSKELREFLSNISTEQLGKYLIECLDKSFTDSGLVLQEIVNELGTRLNCVVENGLYRGKSTAIGFDGIWKYPDGYSIVVEVKTTDAYAINLETIASYRTKLIEKGEINNNSSILIVVGRNDTGGLEAQVRGSRYAWDVRIISAEALLKLVLTKEDADNTTTIEKIRQLLIPQELTKLDFIVDLLATTADDIKLSAEDDDAIQDETNNQKEGKKLTPVSFNDEVAKKVSAHLDVGLKKKTKSLFVSKDGTTAVLCLASKAYEKPNKTFYWYAFHPHQKTALEEYDNAYVTFGCGSAEQVLLFPVSWILDKLSDMNTTENEIRKYWHVQFIKNEENKMMTNFKASTTSHDVTEYMV